MQRWQGKLFMKKRLIALLLTPLLLGGCASIINLTPHQQARKASGLYPVEIEFQTRQNNIRRETLKPIVQVGLESYPMRQVPMLTNRWETLVPVAADKRYVNYRVRVDYDYNSIPIPRSDSRLSPPYQLEIVEGK